MIHEKLKATNSNEFIIKDMVEISNFFLPFQQRQRSEKKIVINKQHEMKTFLNP